MGFWNNVNDELKKAVEEGWTAVRDGAKIGKLRLQLYSLHKKAEGLFAEMGGIVYDMARPPYENPLSRPEVLKLIEDIKKIEEEALRVEEEVKQVRKKEPPSGAGQGPAKK